MLGAFPTGVGMNRNQSRPGVVWWSVPHRRGDEPAGIRPYLQRLGRSPQAWG